MGEWQHQLRGVLPQIRCHGMYMPGTAMEELPRVAVGEHMISASYS